VFQRLTGLLGPTVQHDEAQLIVSGQGEPPYLYVRTQDNTSEGVPAGAMASIIDGQAQVLEAVPGPPRGLRAGLRVPVRIEGRVVGSLALFSSRAGAYSARDLAHAARVANCLPLALTHQRLVDQARTATAERQRFAEIEGCVELLRTISDVLDIRTVFAR